MVHTAALLHDIGKFIFPDSILFAATQADQGGVRDRQAPPGAGRAAGGRIEGYGPVAEIILAHHERIDGKGYPNGLVGEQIPLASRIISVADTYDVMTSRDSYRRPVSSREAIDGAPTRLRLAARPAVVETFIGAPGAALRHVPPRGRRRLRARAEPGAPRARLRRAADARRLRADFRRSGRSSIQRPRAGADTGPGTTTSARRRSSVDRYCGRIYGAKPMMRPFPPAAVLQHRGGHALGLSRRAGRYREQGGSP